MKHDFADSGTLDALESALDEIINGGNETDESKTGFILLLASPSGDGKRMINVISNLDDPWGIALLRSAVEEYDRQNGAAND